VLSDAAECNRLQLQLKKEEDVIPKETTSGQDFSGEEVGSGKDGHVVAMKSFQGVLGLRFGAGAMPCRFRMFPMV